jgi:ribosome recycling factor
MAYNFSTFKDEAKKVEDWLAKEYSQLHTGRASPMVLDGISIESYGARMAIKNIASISIEDPKTLRVVPWDKSQIKGIDNAIVAANIGLSVATDDAGLRVIFPMLTEETRTKMVKILKEKLEDARISVRKERENILDDIKDKNLPEDEAFRAKEELQKHVAEANTKLEAVFEKKEKEVLG